MHHSTLRDPVIERFLALSARYLLHARTDIDERGRVVIEWPERPPQARASRTAGDGSPRERAASM